MIKLHSQYASKCWCRVFYDGGGLVVMIANGTGGIATSLTNYDNSIVNEDRSIATRSSHRPFFSGSSARAFNVAEVKKNSIKPALSNLKLSSLTEQQITSRLVKLRESISSFNNIRENEKCLTVKRLNSCFDIITGLEKLQNEYEMAVIKRHNMLSNLLPRLFNNGIFQSTVEEFVKKENTVVGKMEIYDAILKNKEIFDPWHLKDLSAAIELSDMEVNPAKDRVEFCKKLSSHVNATEARGALREGALKEGLELRLTEVSDIINYVGNNIIKPANPDKA
ncbi:hypothetical protein [uncultured Endozoicomonas sp.]|uniref:hypothetical protein n=1 Tax=uncultured Endozoicomonas sp. TaxID=432652 RepID=UPI0026394509|nr:hypothetical protein [uncultured Endozoicomonas sp.]